MRNRSEERTPKKQGITQDAVSRPEWFEADKADRFASKVVSGNSASGNPTARLLGDVPEKHINKRKSLSLEDYLNGFEEQDRTVFARAITLIESNAEADLKLAQELLRILLPKTGQSVRLGFTGIPGVGKSTLIDTMGYYLCEQGYRVAVLTIDPSSQLSGGSILGDKTRMERLVRHPNAFIRPSPSGGVLGGVARKSRETLLLCEAFGYDVVFVETVGVGQSETTVHSMVDCFILLMIAGAGDELQGIKKGIVELADIIVINKADGENKLRAQAFEREMKNVLHFLSPASQGWTVPTSLCSALDGAGIPELWANILRYISLRKTQGAFMKNRRQQSLKWLYSLIDEYLHHRFYHHPEVKEAMAKITEELTEGRVTAASALQTLITLFESLT